MTCELSKNRITKNMIGIEITKQTKFLKDNMKNCRKRCVDMKADKLSGNERTQSLNLFSEKKENVERRNSMYYLPG